MVDKLKIFGDKGKKNKELSFYFIKDIVGVAVLALISWGIWEAVSKKRKYDNKVFNAF